jgi:hypothetical protein
LDASKLISFISFLNVSVSFLEINYLNISIFSFIQAINFVIPSSGVILGSQPNSLILEISQTKYHKSPILLGSFSIIGFTPEIFSIVFKHSVRDMENFIPPPAL